MVNAIVVDGWLQQVGVVLQPVVSVSMYDRCDGKARTVSRPFGKVQWHRHWQTRYQAARLQINSFLILE